MHRPFKSQTVFDKFGVNRGVMGATVDLPASKGGYIFYFFCQLAWFGLALLLGWAAP